MFVFLRNENNVWCGSECENRMRFIFFNIHFRMDMNWRSFFKKQTKYVHQMRGFRNKTCTGATRSREKQG